MPSSPSLPFLFLPTEIRLQIYNAFFLNATIRTTAPHPLPKGSTTISDPVSDNSTTLNGLLLACRQIRHEALPFMHKHLILHLDPILAHTHLVSPWTAIKPRIATDDLKAFRDVARHVDLGVLNYQHLSYTWANVEDLNLGCLGRLRRVEFRLVLSDAAMFGFMYGEDAGLECGEAVKGGSVAEMLERRWTRQRKRCLGMKERIEKVVVRPSVCGGGSGRVHGNRFQFTIDVRPDED